MPTGNGDSDVSFNKEALNRYKANCWHMQHVAKNNTDEDGITKTIKTDKTVTGIAPIIRVTTTIGSGSPHKAETAGVH